jgi:hypothetical protein
MYEYIFNWNENLEILRGKRKENTWEKPRSPAKGPLVVI